MIKIDDWIKKDGYNYAKHDDVMHMLLRLVRLLTVLEKVNRSVTLPKLDQRHFDEFNHEAEKLYKELYGKNPNEE
jgi:hypothetical protein